MRKLSAFALLTLSALGADTVQHLGPGSSSEASVPISASEECPPDLALLLQEAPRTTQAHPRNGDPGIPGDPLNVALVGTRQELEAAFQAAGWYPADPVTIRSSVGIAASVLFSVSYPKAPLSPLYLWGRPQDLAFEKPVGPNARTRHHARFWCSEATTADGRPIWLGADTFNLWVGRSYTTGRITHHVAADIDKERDNLIRDLQRSGQLPQSYLIPFLRTNGGKNGEGDCYFTDGNIAIGILSGGHNLIVTPELDPGGSCRP